MPEQRQPTEEEIKAYQEKLAKMSPEEREKVFRQQCIFCQIIDGKIDSTKLYEDDVCTVILDINPATPGHMLILPNKHHQVGPQIDEKTMKHLGMVTRGISNCALKALKCEGTTIFIANGATAGQRAQHFMIHIIPRNENDKAGIEVPEFTIDEKQLDELANNLKQYISKKLGVKKPQQKKEEPKEQEKQEQQKEEKTEQQKEEPKEKLVKEKGYLYFLDKDGDVARCKMVRGKKKEKQKQEKVKKLGIKREPGLLYYIDKNLEVKTAPMNRKGRSKKKSTKKSSKKTTARKPNKKKVKEAEIKEDKKPDLDDISRLFT